jgi:hypothetical protein
MHFRTHIPKENYPIFSSQSQDIGRLALQITPEIFEPIAGSHIQIRD